MLASVMAAARNVVDALDDRYSSDATGSLPFPELVEDPSSTESLYGLPRLHTLQHVYDDSCGFCAGAWKRLRLAGSTCSNL